MHPQCSLVQNTGIYGENILNQQDFQMKRMFKLSVLKQLAVPLDVLTIENIQQYQYSLKMSQYFSTSPLSSPERSATYMKTTPNSNPLKQSCSMLLTIQPPPFDISGQGLLQSGNCFTLSGMGRVAGKIVETEGTEEGDLFVFPIFEYGLERMVLQISEAETVGSVKNRVSDIFGCPLPEFDLVYRDQFLVDDCVTIRELGITNEKIVSVKRKILINSLTNGLTNKLKMVESVASGSDKPDNSENEYSSIFTASKDVNIQKKSSCGASLRHIILGEQEGCKKLKYSSIQPYTMHKNNQREEKQNQMQMLKIEDIKETMSYGSLEETKIEQIEIELANLESTLNYRFVCPFGCKMGQVRKILARAERLPDGAIEIVGINDHVLVDDLSVLGDKVRLTFQVHS